nr:GNAT family protein [Polaribacter sp. SA4-10]
MYFRAFEYSDLSLINKIRNDNYAYEHTGGNKYYISSEYDKKWIEDKIFKNQNQIYLAICLIETDELIGYFGINKIDYRNRKAQWAGINVDKKFSNKGYATQAGKLMLKYVFEEIGLYRFYGYWLESNSPSVRMAEKLGFISEGVIRGFVFKGNKFRNAILMSILKEEFDLKHNRKQ